MKYSVTVGYNSAGIYYVYSTDVPGLNDINAKSFDALVGVTKNVARHLLRDPSARVAIRPGLMLCDRLKHRT